MTSRERVQAVLHGQPFDKVPLAHISISGRVASAIMGRETFVGGGTNQWREATALWQGTDAHAAFLRQVEDDAIAIALATGRMIVGCSNMIVPETPPANVEAMIETLADYR